MKTVKDSAPVLVITLYWMAILASSTFGTTSGDFLTNDTPLGAAGGSIFLLFLLAIVTVLNRRGKVSDTIFYWAAIVIIHPIGATIGNYISKPIGLNWGNVWTSVTLVVAFVALFYYGKSQQVEKKEIY